jgi:hypothetical protein
LGAKRIPRICERIDIRGRVEHERESFGCAAGDPQEGSLASERVGKLVRITKLSSEVDECFRELEAAIDAAVMHLECRLLPHDPELEMRRSAEHVRERFRELDSFSFESREVKRDLRPIQIGPRREHLPAAGGVRCDELPRKELLCRHGRGKPPRTVRPLELEDPMSMKDFLASDCAVREPDSIHDDGQCGRAIRLRHDVDLGSRDGDAVVFLENIDRRQQFVLGRCGERAQLLQIIGDERLDECDACVGRGGGNSKRSSEKKRQHDSPLMHQE